MKSVIVSVSLYILSFIVMLICIVVCLNIDAFDVPWFLIVPLPVIAFAVILVAKYIEDEADYANYKKKSMNDLKPDHKTINFITFKSHNKIKSSYIYYDFLDKDLITAIDNQIVIPLYDIYRKAVYNTATETEFINKQDEFIRIYDVISATILEIENTRQDDIKQKYQMLFRKFIPDIGTALCCAAKDITRQYQYAKDKEMAELELDYKQACAKVPQFVDKLNSIMDEESKIMHKYDEDDDNEDEYEYVLHYGIKTGNQYKSKKKNKKKNRKD